MECSERRPNDDQGGSMKCGDAGHLVRRVAGCILFFGMVAPPLGGVVMFLLMMYGTTGSLVPYSPGAGDMLNMVAFIGVFSFTFGFLPACLVGAIVGIAHPSISRLRWFLLLCAVLSAAAPGLLNAGQQILGLVAVLPGIITGLLWWCRGMRDGSHNVY